MWHDDLSQTVVIGGIFDDIGKTVSGVAKGTTGAAGALLTGKVKKAGQKVGGAVKAVTGNKLLQAGWPGTFVPAAIVAGASRGGVKGAANAAKQVAKNPLIKAEMAGAAILFPPVAPFSGAAIAASETAARTADDLQSGDPKRIAAAAFKVAGTTLLASQGHPDAKRGVQALKSVQQAQKLAKGFVTGDPKAKALIASAKAKGTSKAKAGISLVQHMAAREAMLMASSSNPAVRKRASEIITKLQIDAPSLVQAVKTAMTSPKGVNVGQFAVLRTGRILHHGKPIRSSSTKSLASARASGVRR